ncbi:MAG: hypothetical protein VXZ38_03050, partial [Planctomycetota bacterium]|nr:hypothetical protein [Planctomycetota bacterium]
MSAPALRRYEIGRALSDDFDVAFGLADPSRAHGALGGARIVENRNRKQFFRNLKSCDFLYTLGVQPREYNAVARSGVNLILDYYTPRPFETLE